MASSSEKLLLIVTTFFISFSAWSQSYFDPSHLERDQPRNSVYAEVLGNGVFGSINYERITPDRSGDFALNTRIGLGYWNSLVVPVEASIVYKHFEVGAGVTTVLEPLSSVTLLRFGFKTFVYDRLLLRFGLTPRVAGKATPVGGISVGVGF